MQVGERRSGRASDGMAREWTGVVCWRGKEFLFYVIPVYILVGLDLVYAWPYACSPLALPMYGYWGERGEGGG